LDGAGSGSRAEPEETEATSQRASEGRAKWDCGGTLTRCCSDVGAGVAAAVAAAAATAASGGGAGPVPAVRGHGEEAIGYAVMRTPLCREAGAEKFAGESMESGLPGSLVLFWAHMLRAGCPAI
jgi:hypothetical protein